MFYFFHFRSFKLSHNQKKPSFHHLPFIFFIVEFIFSNIWIINLHSYRKQHYQVKWNALVHLWTFSKFEGIHLLLRLLSSALSYIYNHLWFLVNACIYSKYFQCSQCFKTSHILILNLGAPLFLGFDILIFCVHFHHNVLFWTLKMSPILYLANILFTSTPPETTNIFFSVLPFFHFRKIM